MRKLKPCVQRRRLSGYHLVIFVALLVFAAATSPVCNGLSLVDNHRTMLDRLEATGALPDLSSVPKRLLRRPREIRYSPPLKLTKRSTVTMHRQWKMDEEETSQTGNQVFFSAETHPVQINRSADDSMPSISFKTAEENTIELLVVVTHKMHRILGGRLTEYLVATIGSVAQNFKHSSLKASVKISIVDIILLDSNFARREGLEDWSNKNHEEVMGKFCHWVNRVRGHSLNWDSAILLNVGNFKTTALGVAHYKAMCSRESSCLVVVDRGFGTADIIAHEIGHQLGAKHDFEVGSECGLEEQPGRKRPVQKLSRRTPGEDDLTYHRDTIMSGILYFELYPFRWSACSRQNIQFFLSRPDSSCLRVKNSPTTAFTSKQLTLHTAAQKPGLRFTLNEQCELALRQRGSRFCGHNSPVCKQLHCYDVQREMCLPVEAPWAEGSRCGYKRWCVSGQCLPQGEKIVPIDGGWSAWYEWGPCSRSCGGGVQFSYRECTRPEPQNGGEHCLGTNVRVRSCNVQDCPQWTDIRQELCDKVGRMYNKYLHAYKPSIGGANACKLVCLDGTTEMPHYEELPDGTPCYSHGTDICIKGECWQAGCDKVLGSQMQRDNCDVCGGDNSTCYPVSGEFHHSDALAPGAKPVGLTIAVHIPQGVTNAYIRKVSRRSTPYSSDAYDDFMLLIFEELKTRIRRGETWEPFAGGELYYSGSRGKEEIVHIKGHINKNVNILIRVENKNTDQPLPDVEYTYYVSKNARDHLRFNPSAYTEHHYNDPLLRFLRSPRKDSTPSEEQSASEMSESGAQTANQSPAPHQPETPQRLPEEPIRFEWRIDDVPKECTSCAGVVESHASCYPVFSSEKAAKRYGMHPVRPLPARYCGENARPAPVTRNCNDYCGVRWAWREVNASDYGGGGGGTSAVSAATGGGGGGTRSACSVRCGEGVEEVRYTAICEEKVYDRDTTWRESSLGAYACVKAELGEPPEDRVVINRCNGECRPVAWIFSDWYECSERCGGGTKHRSVTCVDDVGNHWPLSECLQHSSSPQVGKLSGIDGYVGAESIDCFDVSGCGGHFAWTTSAWSECHSVTSHTDMSGLCRSSLKRHLDGTGLSLLGASVFNGMQSRSVKCVIRSGPNGEDQREAPEHYCEHAQVPKPPEKQVCSVLLTCFRWSYVHFSQCSATCGVGHRVGQLTCEQVTASRGETPKVTPVGEAECIYRLGNNVTLLVDSHREDLTVYIVGKDSVEEHEALQRAPYIHPIAYVPGKSILYPCSNPPCHSSSLQWVAGDWSSCSATCGVGFQRRSVRCVLVERHSSGLSAAETIMTDEPDVQCIARSLPKPPDMRLCQGAPCVKWVAGEWSECTGLCESGSQERPVRCVREKLLYATPPESVMWESMTPPPPELSSSTVIEEEQVSPQACDLQPRPAEKRVCLLSSDCPFWYQGPWSSCSATCGVGRRFRHVDCRFPNGTVLYASIRTSRGLTALSRRRRDYLSGYSEHFGSLRCPEPRPVDKTECQLAPCQEDRPFWWPIVSTACHAIGCNRGYQDRELQCLTPSFEQVDLKKCQFSRKPLKRVPCMQQECKTYRWRTDAWSKCPYACGKHSRYRNVRCVDDLGVEYADHLCQAHLRPESYGLCPNACPDYPISCWDQKQRYPSSTDGVYDLEVNQQIVRIYCSDMESSYPREYLPLHQLNYAAIRHVAETIEQNCTTEEAYFIDRITDTNVTLNASGKLHSHHLSESPADSVTIFTKLRLELNSLQVDIFDGLFSETWGKRFVPYATARSCSRGTCQLGKFLINLEGTGFAIAGETQWRTTRQNSFGHVLRTEGSVIIMGTCGGDCGGCWPDPNLRLKIVDATKR